MSFTIFHRHVCRTATITMSPDHVAAYDEWRLGDGDIGKKCKFSTAVAPYIKINQGASPLAITRIIIPGSTHNLSGMRCTLSSSDNDSSYTQRDQWTQADALVINRSFATQTHRYWKLAFDNGSGGNPASAPEMAELFLTDGYTFERGPYYPYSGYSDGPAFNVVAQKTPSGKVGFLEKGAKVQRYSLKLIMDDAMAVNMRTWRDAWAGKNPFPIVDIDGNTVIVWATSFGEITRERDDRHTCDVELEELLP